PRREPTGSSRWRQTCEPSSVSCHEADGATQGGGPFVEARGLEPNEPIGGIGCGRPLPQGARPHDPHADHRRRADDGRPALRPPRAGEKPFWSDVHRPPAPMEIPVSAIMTSPAISADEETPVSDLCRIMWNLRIHRIPILRRGRVTGLVSSMDLCRAILDGKIRA